MLPVLLTIDTEYSSGLYARGMHDRAANFAATIACKSARGEAGIFHQMRVFAEHGLKAVFFVDPLPALVWGQGAVDDVVGPILAAGTRCNCTCTPNGSSSRTTTSSGGGAGGASRIFRRTIRRS